MTFGVSFSHGELRLRLVPLLWSSLGLLSLKWLLPHLAASVKKRFGPQQQQKKQIGIPGRPAGLPMQSIARAMKHCQAGVRAIPFSAFVAGLTQTGRASFDEGEKQIGRETAIATDSDTLEEIRHWLCFAEAAYAADSVEFSIVSQLPVGSLVVCELMPCIETNRPAYVVALDCSRHALVVTLRGTADPIDVITDMAAFPVAFPDHTSTQFAHEGMAAAASQVLHEILEPVQEILQSHPTFRLVVVGHSMGGGTAALLALLLQEAMPGVSVHGYSFGTPSCASMGLARRAASCVTSVSCTHDIVPSLSVHAVDRLCKTIELEMPQSKAKKPKEVGASKPYTHDKAVALYPPGRLLVLGWHEGGSPPRRKSLPKIFLGAYFTRKLGIDWDLHREDSAVCWTLTEASPEDFGHIRMTPWSLSDHMLGTVAEGLHALHLQTMNRGQNLL